MKTQLRLDCTCQGCRRRVSDLAGIWQASQIRDRVQGHYLDPDTMRFFRSRILSWSYDSETGSLQVLTSNAGDWDNTSRRYDVVTYCRYGSLIVEPDDMTGGAVRRQYSTAKAARRDMAANGGRAAAVCDCHGCQLDRAGQ